jgi:3-phosphoshikimate 1-carboxyvinyltransferase
MHAASEQGERAIVDILTRLGSRVEFDRERHTLTVDNPDGMPRGGVEVDASDFPNIVPTLAAIGAYTDGRFRVVGGKITRFHKASRIEAMVSELSGAGVDIGILYDNGVCDGFEVRGAGTYAGGRKFSSWGDHRIFMSLFVASLRMHSPSFFSGFEDVRLSFPEFFSEFAKAGVVTDVVENPDEVDESARAVA